VPIADVLAQIAGIAGAVIAAVDRADIRLLAAVDALVGLVLGLRRAAVAAVRAHVLALARVLSQVVLQLLLRAEGLAALRDRAVFRRDAVRAHVLVVVRVRPADVPQELAAVVEVVR